MGNKGYVTMAKAHILGPIKIVVIMNDCLPVKCFKSFDEKSKTLQKVSASYAEDRKILNDDFSCTKTGNSLKMQENTKIL